MAKHSSPNLTVHITPEQWDKAVRSNSGGCLIADSIKTQYPHLSNPTVDMATIRVTDLAKGVRYTYLTPPTAQHLLLAFDQGWPNPEAEVVIRRAVVITPVTRTRTGPDGIARTKARREARKAELDAKIAAGETLTANEKRSLAVVSKPYEPVERPVSTGPADVKVTAGGTRGAPAVKHGRAPMQGDAHPNLLRGRDRHFGAKLADPGIAFREAVDAAVEARMAEA